MNISDRDILKLEKRGILVVQSDYPEIIYAIDREHDVMWLINRQTGAQLEIAQCNAYKLADEMVSVADLYMGNQELRKIG